MQRDDEADFHGQTSSDTARTARPAQGLAARAVRERLRAYASTALAEEVERRALRLAARLAIPEDGRALGLFLERSLLPSASVILGADIAESLAAELHPIAQRASKAPSPPALRPLRPRVSSAPTMVPPSTAQAVVESGVVLKAELFDEAPDLRPRASRSRASARSSTRPAPTPEERALMARGGEVTELPTASGDVAAVENELPTVRPPAFEPTAADAVYARSAELAASGPSELGLSMAEDAVRLRRQLAEEDPVGQAASLAQALHNYGLHLGALGRPAEALVAYDEAVSLRRRLATEAPLEQSELAEAQLARSLHGLALQLARLGRHAQAVAALDETISIRLCLDDADLRPALERAEKLRVRLAALVPVAAAAG